VAGWTAINKLLHEAPTPKMTPSKTVVSAALVVDQAALTDSLLDPTFAKNKPCKVSEDTFKAAVEMFSEDDDTNGRKKITGLTDPSPDVPEIAKKFNDAKTLLSEMQDAVTLPKQVIL